MKWLIDFEVFTCMDDEDELFTDICLLRVHNNSINADDLSTVVDLLDDEIKDRSKHFGDGQYYEIVVDATVGMDYWTGCYEMRIKVVSCSQFIHKYNPSHELEIPF